MYLFECDNLVTSPYNLIIIITIIISYKKHPRDAMQIIKVINKTRKFYLFTGRHLVSIVDKYEL